MNIHQGVAMRSDVKFLRDGTSGLREVVEQLGTGTLSKSAQDELKRKPNVILVDQTLVTDDLHSQMSGVSGTGSSEYVAKPLATDQKYFALASPTQSDHMAAYCESTRLDQCEGQDV